MVAEYSDAKRNLLEKYLRGEFGAPRATPTIPRRNPDQTIPLSYAQEQVWLHAQLAPELPLYNEPVTIHYSGELNVAALENSFNEILRRHEAWRTCFTVVEGQPVQEVRPHLSISLPVLDLRSLPNEQRETAALRVATEDARKPLDLAQVPLFRVRLIRLEDQEYRLYLTLSHIIFDGVAIYRVFLPELSTLYKAYSSGQPSPLPKLPIQYPDYACWQRQCMTGEALAKEVEFWRKRLSGSLPETYLPTDRPHKRWQTFRGSMYPFKLNSSLTTALRSFCRTEGVSLFHVLLAGFAALLYRYSGEETIPIGSVTAGRDRPETQVLLGYFLNTVVLPVDLSGDPSFREMVKRARNLTIDALEHDSLPFAYLVKELKVQRDPGRNPLFQALFSLEPPLPEVDPAWRLTQMDVDTGTSKYDLFLELDERSEEVLARFHYSTDLFDAGTIERMQQHFRNLLQGIVAEPGRPIAELPLIEAIEVEQLVVDLNETTAEFPRDLCLHHFFEQQVARTPDAVAVISPDERISYGQLNQRADRLAAYLRQQGVGPEVLVGLCTDRSLNLLVGILGILKAGGAYVPLDPAYPQARLDCILEDAHVSILLTQQNLSEKFAGSSVNALCLDRDWPTIEGAVKSRERNVTPQNLAYVLFTSGSTGRPKGVAVEHRNAANFVQWAQTVFTREELARTLFATSMCFDLSIFEMFVPWSVGGAVVVAENIVSFSELSATGEVTLINTVPSAMTELVRSGAVPASVLTVNLAGEALPSSLVCDLYERTQVRNVYNLYGPTEATTYATYAPVGPHADVTIGKPIANTQAYILDSHRKLVPQGVPGELYLGGEGLARGYFGHPDLTAEKFVSNPFSPTPGARLYKTGDLARLLPDGNIEYLGRNDHQVKIRGFRIELGEIEAALASHPGVREAVVVAREDAPGEKRLVAYYTVSNANGKPTGVAELCSHLSGKLPDYMVPAAYVRMEGMPLTANGKLDRKALPMPEGDAYAVRGYEAPQGETETRLAEIWADVLKIDRVGRNDNFFELGGHSLLAVMLIERIRQQGLRVDVRTLFMTPTLAGLSAAADKGANLEVPENRIPMACEVITPQMLPLVTLSQEEIDRIVNNVPGGAGNVQDIYPLAPLQEGILFHHLLGGEGDPYLMGGLLSFDTRRRLDGYVEAMQKVIDRHDILRTAVVWEGLREPVQVVQRKALLSVEEVKLDAAGGDRSQQLQARFDPRHWIDVRQAPLLRVYIAYDEQKDRWLMMELLHHLAGDHVTWEVMREEVQAHLLKQAHTLPTPQPFRNLVAQSRLGMSQAEHQVYFQKLLGDVDEPTAPFGLLDVQGDGTGIEEASTVLDSVLARRIRERARKLGVSAASLCHLAWAQVLARVSGRDDVVFGTVLFGRMQGGQGADRVMGLFINTLPVRIQIGEEEVEGSVRRVHAQLADLLQHEHASLALAQRCSGVAAPTPLFSALLNYRHSGGAARSGSAEGQRAWEGVEFLRSEERTSYPFTLSVDDVAEGFGLTAQTVASVGAKRACQYMRAALEGLVEALEKEPGRAVRTLDVLPVAEREQVLFKFNDTALEYPREKCIPELFEEQVEKSPGNTAVVFEDTSLTYGELNRRANQLAWHLRRRGVGPEVLVGLALERSLELVVGVLGILKAGGAYVPLDATYPPERLALILEDAGAEIVVTQEKLRSKLPRHSAKEMCLDADWDTIARHSTENPLIASRSEDTAYVIYTSGSTGTPKGVEGTHRGALNRFAWMWQAYPFQAGEVCCQKTNLGFVDSIWEIFGPLLAGVPSVVIPPETVRDPEELLNTLARERVTRIVLVPSLLRSLLDRAPNLEARVPQLKLWSCSGEVLSRELAERFRAASPQARLLNLYGSSEVAGDVTCHEVGAQEGTGPVPIGKPISNTQIYVLDEHMNPVPMGVRGQIYAGGEGLAAGYWKRPELTAERFVANRFGAGRLYKTGDLARYLEDGAIEYLGRNDHQVKIRGFRIELEEIEAALASHPGVREAVVVAREDAPGEKRLVAYYTVSNANGKPTGVAELRSHLSGKLPDYMVPAAYVRMEGMRLTANGKLDRRALPMPEGDAYAVRGHEAPQGETETRLAEIWADVLKIDRVGRNDNFFELGGHSLLAMQVMARVRHVFNLELPVRSMFEKPTIAGLAGELPRAQALGFKARTSIAQQRSSSAAASPNRKALLAQLDNLSATELQSLLQHGLDEKYPE